MNPSFTAMQKAWMTTMSNMLFGIEHKPKKAGDKETSINGRAFAPGKGVQQLESSEEKEANIRKHLVKLASEAKARYLKHIAEFPTVREIDAKKRYVETQAEIQRGKADAWQIGVAYSPPHIMRHQKPYSAEELSSAKKEDREAYIQRQMEINRRTELLDLKADAEPNYPTSDLIDALHEHLAEIDAHTAITDRIDAAHTACVYTGERMTLEVTEGAAEAYANGRKQALKEWDIEHPNGFKGSPLTAEDHEHNRGLALLKATGRAPSPPSERTYPCSDLVTAMEEARDKHDTAVNKATVEAITENIRQSEERYNLAKDAAIEAAIDKTNFDNYTNEEIAKWHQQG